jgi:hypothetical protein
MEGGRRPTHVTMQHEDARATAVPASFKFLPPPPKTSTQTIDNNLAIALPSFAQLGLGYFL